MNRVLVVAPSPTHMLNWVKTTGITVNFFLYVDDPLQIRKMDEGMRHVWIDNPRGYRGTDLTMQELRRNKSVKLPIDVNEWPISELPHG